MLMNLEEVFEKFNDDYIEFDQVENKLSRRPDLHAFLLIDSLVPGTSDLIVASEHDEYFLSVTIEELAKVITDEQVRDLVRCGVRISQDSLAFFA